ncbi:hypothetical protein Cri9333_4801 (plasmid) [Crinalium epipsammum PCC 9333]|uniref:Cytotoxic translational repressor of toxin-antitoxin stability system n=1 Tax=Crinalium epipsammum PCC 9333 TaxID=1173022 RepID=K9W5X1_9CYAN|nr:hypothetical protein [Crinalium epipsammum]AFZ15571.1 hypothetical protein Cri9333_4801 [Crinalium epipsammum PCC 9333]
MQFRLLLEPEAESTLNSLKELEPKKYKKVLKTLGLLESNPRHPGLNTHKYDDLTGPNKEIVFEAYVENRTPGAFRVFWYYGSKGVINVLAITPHP